MNALVTDAFGNPVENGTAVTFSLKDDPLGGTAYVAPPTYGIICGSSLTGDPEMDTACTLATGSEIKGVAHSKMTWVAEGIGIPYQVTATTSGVTTPGIYENDYPAVAPLEILVTLTPDSAPGNFGGPGGISVVAEYIDGAAFPNPIGGVDLDFTSSSAFATVVSTPVVTDLDGFAYTTVTTTACLPTNTQVTIIASDPPVSGSDTMTILATDPTASFTVSGTSPTFSFTNTSTEPPGYNYSYLWSFGDTNTSTSENPSHTYAAPGTYTVTLTVTNTGAPGACSDIATDSVTVL